MSSYDGKGMTRGKDSLPDHPGEGLERWLASAYRTIGARKVVRKMPMNGIELDLYVELPTPCSRHSAHRLALEAKDWTSRVGIKIVRDFASTVYLLREKGRLVDEGAIVSSAGFTARAHEFAEAHGVTLLEPADIDAMVSEALGSGQAGIASSIVLFRQAARAGRYDQAEEIFRTYLSRALYYRVGDYQLCIDLLSALFPNGDEHPPSLRKQCDHAWVINALGNSYMRAGRGREAERLYEASTEIDQIQGNKRSLTIGLCNLADAQLALGELSKADASLRDAVKLSREIGNEFHVGLAHQELGRLLSYTGNFGEAEEELDVAMFSYTETGQSRSECVVWQYRSLRHLLRDDPANALDNARRAYRLAAQAGREHYGAERDVVRIGWLLSWALTALAGREKSLQRRYLAEAERHATEALWACRKSHLVELEPDILLVRARWHRAKTHPKRAREDAEEALAIAGRCALRLKQATIRNFLARLASESGDEEQARKQAQIAAERAICDGGEHCYKPALDEALGLLS